MAKETNMLGIGETQVIPVVQAVAVTTGGASNGAEHAALANVPDMQTVPGIAQDNDSSKQVLQCPTVPPNNDDDTCSCCAIICGSAAATAAVVCFCCCVLPVIIALIFLLGNPKVVEDSKIWDG